MSWSTLFSVWVRGRTLGLGTFVVGIEIHSWLRCAVDGTF
jgi:hypothetical protein